MFINSGAPALTLHRWHASVTSTSAPYGFFNFTETERAWWLTGRIVFHRLQEIFADMTELLDKRFPISQDAILWLVAVFWFFFRVKVVEIAEKFIEAVHGWPVLVPITLMVLAKLSSCISLALSTVAMVTSVFCQPCGAPGNPTLVMPVRTGTLPPMNAARPAVQLCWA